MDLLYDYDDTKENSTDELLEYVDEIDTLLRTKANVPKVDYVWYNGVLNSDNINFKNEALNSVVWVYNSTDN
ncbi:MAG: hypothetical protein BWY15_02117 [Firmicutes bacterium ADurb.Bin193]|nr:MAG: hypothetical protein BWY15_02117 [Firmicutes bacterium ADurb.Bin193]